MKKSIIIISVLLIAAYNPVLQAQFIIGVTAGSIESLGEYVTHKNPPGYCGGLIMEYRFKNNISSGISVSYIQFEKENICFSSFVQQPNPQEIFIEIWQGVEAGYFLFPRH